MLSRRRHRPSFHAVELAGCCGLFLLCIALAILAVAVHASPDEARAILDFVPTPSLAIRG